MGELTDDFIFGDRAGDSDWSDGGASPSFVDGVRQGPSGPLPEGSGIIHTRHHSEIYRKTNAVLASQEGTNVAATGVLYEKLSEQNVGRRNDHRNAGMRSSIVTLMNSCLGASLLVLPFVCAETGVAVFLILVSFIGVLSNETLKLLTLCVKHTEQSCYQGVGREAFGARGATGTSILITLQLFGFMVAYLIVVGNMLQSVMKLLPHAEASLVAWQIGVSALIVLPLCMLRRMHYLRFSAIIAITLFLVYVVASSVDATHQLITWPTKSVPGTVSWVSNVPRILAALPVVCCSYACHQNLFPIIEEVQRPTVGRLARVTRNAMGLVAATYCVCGVAGYLTFLGETQGDLLLNYAQTATFVPQQFLQFVGYFIGIAIVLSLPVMCFELRNGLDVMFFGGQKFSWVRHTAWNVALVSATTTVAILIPQVETVFSFIGALCSTTVVFTLPGVFYLKVAPPDARDGRFTRAKAWGVAIGGAVLTPVCLTILTLQQLNVLPKS